MKNFKGKAIYQPSGKAAEYAAWACDCYVGQDRPQLKKCFKGGRHAAEIFFKEMKTNLSELQKHGLFFSFTTDPLLPETIDFTMWAIMACEEFNIPVKILTKCTKWLDGLIPENGITNNKNIAFGFTLTGHDELEPNASTNAERIEAIRKLHDAGFKTFVSFEPMLNDWYVINTLIKYNQFIDLAMIGLESGCGKIKYLYEFTEDILAIEGMKTKIYFKDSLLKQAGINRADLPANCVTRDYSLFNTPQL